MTIPTPRELVANSPAYVLRVCPKCGNEAAFLRSNPTRDMQRCHNHDDHAGVLMVAEHVA